MSKVESGSPNPLLEDAFNLVLRVSISRTFTTSPQITRFSAALDFQSQRSSPNIFGWNLLPFLFVLSLVKRSKHLKATTVFICSLYQEKILISAAVFFKLVLLLSSTSPMAGPQVVLPSFDHYEMGS